MVVLYTNHCPLCNYLKDLLDNKHIEYQEVTDIDYMLSLGITKTPMLQVDNGELMKYKQALDWVNEKR